MSNGVRMKASVPDTSQLFLSGDVAMWFFAHGQRVLQLQLTIRRSVDRVVFETSYSASKSVEDLDSFRNADVSSGATGNGRS